MAADELELRESQVANPFRWVEDGRVGEEYTAWAGVGHPYPPHLRMTTTDNSLKCTKNEEPCTKVWTNVRCHLPAVIQP